MKNSFIDSEDSIAREFRIKIAQMGPSEENMSGEMPQAGNPMAGPMPGGAPSGSQGSPDQVMQQLESPDSQQVDVLDWNSFTIEKNDEYADMLQKEQNMDLPDAMDKAYYIRYKTPKELLAVQGTILGKNADKGKGLLHVGGYNTYENLQKELDMLQSEAYFKGGIPEKLKDDILVPLSELSDSFEEYKKSKEEDKTERQKEELENPLEAEEEKIPSDEDTIEAFPEEEMPSEESLSPEEQQTMEQQAVPKEIPEEGIKSTPLAEEIPTAEAPQPEELNPEKVKKSPTKKKKLSPAIPKLKTKKTNLDIINSRIFKRLSRLDNLTTIIK